jgi:indole-3-glycerol phosphate synthase
MSGDLLPAMIASARRSAEERRRRSDWADIERAAGARLPRGTAFEGSVAAPGTRIISECKRRSPSRGVLRAAYDPAAIAAAYEVAGAAAVSVLTEPTFFDGSLDHLRAVRAAVSLPVLRKDFIVIEPQLVEARAAGADAVLLIVAALDDATLRSLIAAAGGLSLAPLVEVHDMKELTRALAAGARIVGVNSRNLRTLEVATATFDALASSIPDDVVAVAESGIRSAGEIARLQSLGYDAFLIGERFMTAPDPGGALADLIAAPASRGAAS